jgi:hypothetical protein
MNSDRHGVGKHNTKELKYAAHTPKFLMVFDPFEFIFPFLR